MSTKLPTVEQLKARIRFKSARVVEFMNSEIGRAVIDALEEQFFDGEIADMENPNHTYYRLGQRDVVTYLRELQNVTERD